MKHSLAANTYRHPRKGVIGALIEGIANSRPLATARRAVTSRLPFLKLESEVVDIVYLTWMVPVGACAGFVPEGVALWQRNGLTPFTVLTYRHGHFGPSLLGPLRRLCPSPLQSNWRLYLEKAPAGTRQVQTVLFLKNIMDSLPYALGTRVFSDALPTHLAARFEHVREGEVYRTSIEPGSGSAPTLEGQVRLAHESKTLSAEFASAFGAWPEAVNFLACQEAAVAHVESAGRIAFAEIGLPIDVPGILAAEPAGEEVRCPLLDALGPVGAPLCFVVPGVRFTAVSERVL